MSTYYGAMVALAGRAPFDRGDVLLERDKNLPIHRGKADKSSSNVDRDVVEKLMHTKQAFRLEVQPKDEHECPRCHHMTFFTVRDITMG
jgi:hypothetical protein